MATKEQIREETEALARRYIEARKTHEAAQEAEIRAGREKYDAEMALVERLIENSPSKAGACVDGLTFSIRRSSHISITKENHDEALGWLSLEMGRDAVQDYMSVKLDRWAVERWVKEQLREGKVEQDFPPCLKLYTESRISVRGWDNDDDAPKPQAER